MLKNVPARIYYTVFYIEYNNFVRDVILEYFCAVFSQKYSLVTVGSTLNTNEINEIFLFSLETFVN